MQSSRTLALIALVAALLVPAAARADQTWLVVSDIHLNPYDAYRRPSPPGSDSNLALLESSLAAMKRAVPEPAMVVLPGDFLAHYFPRLVNLNAAGSSQSGEALKAVQIVATRFGRTFPHARFAVVLGNNDSACGDYRSDVDGPFMQGFARAWAPLVNRGGAATQFAQTFPSGGYYTEALPIRGLRLIGLNSTVFSKEFFGDCRGGHADQATGELAWLNATLASTPPGIHNVVLLHVPPGYDTFVTETARGAVAWPYYFGAANAGLLDAISQNATHVAFVLAGHTHHFDFRIVPSKPPVPMIVFGAVSPVYRNNPNFATIQVTPEGNVRDLTLYAFDETTLTWLPGRNFNEAWKPDPPELGAASLEGIHARLHGSPQMRTAWEGQTAAWAARNPRLLWAAGWPVAWCAQTNLDAAFAACAKTGDPMAWVRLGLAVTPAVLLAIVLVIVIRRRIRL